MTIDIQNIETLRQISRTDAKTLRHLKSTNPSMQFTYKSDYDPDFRCLESCLKNGTAGILHDKIRHEYHKNLSFDDKNLIEIASKIPGVDINELSKRYEQELPTRYDSPLNFRILDDLVASIKSSALRLSINVDDFPYYSCIPTGQVNARAAIFPCSKKHFLLFDSQIFIYCHLFSKAFALCLPVTSDDNGLSFSIDIEKIKTHLENDPVILSRMIDVLDSYTRTGRPSNAQPYIAEINYQHLSTIFRESMELFIVAHEFGHVYSGHLSRLLNIDSINALEDLKTTGSHVKEHQADFLGLLLTFEEMTHQGYDHAVSYVGIYMFFKSLDIADQYENLIKGKPKEIPKNNAEDSHPSNQARVDFLDLAVERIIHDPEDLDALRALKSKYEEVFSFLLESIEKKVNQPLSST